MFMVTADGENGLFLWIGWRQQLTSTESLDQVVGGKVRLGISDIVHCLPGFRLNCQKLGQYWLSADSVAFETEIWVVFSHIQCAWRYWGTNKFPSFDIPNRDDVGLQRVTAFLNLATFVKEQMSLRENFAKLFPKKTFQEKLRFSMWYQIDVGKK